MARHRPQAPPVDGWISRLEPGDEGEARLEIFLKARQQRIKIRASGTEEQMDQLLDWFEGQTGVRVEVPNRQRLRRGPTPPENQMTLVMGDVTDGG